MVTGDYHHTAIAVSRGIGMLTPGKQLVIVQAKSELQITAESPDRASFAFSSINSSRYTGYPALSSPSKPGSKGNSLDMARWSVSKDPSKPGSRGNSLDMARWSVSKDPSKPGSRGNSLDMARWLVSKDPSKPGSRGNSLDMTRWSVSKDPSKPGSKVNSLDMARWAVSRDPSKPASRHQSFTHAYGGPSPASMLMSASEQATSQATLNAADTVLTPLSEQVIQSASAPHLTALSAQLCLPVPPGLSVSAHQLQASEQPFRHQLSQLQNPVEQLPQQLSTHQQSGHQQSAHESKCAAGHLQPGVEEAVMSQQESPQLHMLQELGAEACAGLVFMLQSEEHVEELTAQQAITSLAQVAYHAHDTCYNGSNALFCCTALLPPNMLLTYITLL